MGEVAQPGEGYDLDVECRAGSRVEEAAGADRRRMGAERAGRRQGAGGVPRRGRRRAREDAVNRQRAYPYLLPVPSPACGGGLGRGHVADAEFGLCPLPPPPPPAGGGGGSTDFF